MKKEHTVYFKVIHGAETKLLTGLIYLDQGSACRPSRPKLRKKDDLPLVTYGILSARKSAIRLFQVK